MSRKFFISWTRASSALVLLIAIALGALPGCYSESVESEAYFRDGRPCAVTFGMADDLKLEPEACIREQLLAAFPIGTRREDVAATADRMGLLRSAIVLPDSRNSPLGVADTQIRTGFESRQSSVIEDGPVRTLTFRFDGKDRLTQIVVGSVKSGDAVLPGFEIE